MELIALLFDFILHVDKHLEAFVQNYGWWVYALLFLIIFVETGVVVMPFLPGDSLLFVVGAMCGAGLMSYPVATAVLVTAAILGDQCNYAIGRAVGPKVFQWENSRFFNKAAFNRAHDFYERYGGITIILARSILAHFCAICGRCGTYEPGQIHAVQHRWCPDLGVWHLHCRLLFGQHALG